MFIKDVNEITNNIILFLEIIRIIVLFHLFVILCKFYKLQD